MLSGDGQELYNVSHSFPCTSIRLSRSLLPSEIPSNVLSMLKPDLEQSRLASKHCCLAATQDFSITSMLPQCGRLGGFRGNHQSAVPENLNKGANLRCVALPLVVKLGLLGSLLSEIRTGLVICV